MYARSTCNIDTSLPSSLLALHALLLLLAYGGTAALVLLLLLLLLLVLLLLWSSSMLPCAVKPAADAHICE